MRGFTPHLAAMRAESIRYQLSQNDAKLEQLIGHTLDFDALEQAMVLRARLRAGADQLDALCHASRRESN